MEEYSRYPRSMKNKKCVMCSETAEAGKVICSNECDTAMGFKQWTLDRHRSRAKNPDSYNVTVVDWMKILKDFDNRCAYCRRSGQMTIDHVVPLSRGGRHSISNLVPACRSCNKQKGSLTISEWRLAPHLKSKVRNPQGLSWYVDARMGIRPDKGKYKRAQAPIFDALMNENYNNITIARMGLTVDHFGVLAD
jgi:5-methylcytosine-specific restriction endonuclease McrA